MTLENRTGINLSATKIKFVEFVFRNNEYILEYLDEAYFNDEIDLVTDKETKILSNLQAAFNEIAVKTNIAGKTLFISLPAECFYIQRLPYDNTLLEQDLLTQFRWEFSLLYPHESVDDYAITFYEIAENIFSRNRHALLVALNRKFLRIAKSFAQKNNFELHTVDYAHFSCDSALLLNYPAVSDGAYITLLVDSGALSFELLMNGKPVYARTRKLKNTAELHTAINVELEYLSENNIPIAQISSAFIYADRLSPSFLSSLEEHTRLKIFPVNPFKRFTIHSKLSSVKILKDYFYAFAPAAGACYRLF